jgi:hypothetical protein
LLSLGLLVAVLPMALQTCGGPIVRGDTFVNVWCQPGGDGIYFTAVTTGFRPYTKFHYEYTVWFNGLHLESNRSGDYYTDGAGNHNGMSRRWEDCGHGLYRVYVVSVSDDGNNETHGSTREVAC